MYMRWFLAGWAASLHALYTVGVVLWAHGTAGLGTPQLHLRPWVEPRESISNLDSCSVSYFPHPRVTDGEQEKWQPTH